MGGREVKSQGKGSEGTQFDGGESCCLCREFPDKSGGCQFANSELEAKIAV
jgi:hypothetical protein